MLIFRYLILIIEKPIWLIPIILAKLDNQISKITNFNFRALDLFNNKVDFETFISNYSKLWHILLAKFDN